MREARRALGAVTALGGHVDGGIGFLTHVPEELSAFVRKLRQADSDGSSGWADVGDEHLDLPGLRGSILRQAVNILGMVGQPDRALAMLDERAGDITAEQEQILAAEKGVLLAETGRFEEADAQLPPVLQQLSDDETRGYRVHLAGRWARALDGAGRTEEADRVWSTYGENA